MTFRSPNAAERRILRRIAERGSTNPHDWIGPDVCDGGAEILRLGARIHDLKVECGYRVDSEICVTGSGKRYAVYSNPVAPDGMEGAAAARPSAAVPSVPSESKGVSASLGGGAGTPGSLFDPAGFAARPSSAINDDLERAA